MARCWERRGCDEAMQARCLHAVSDSEKCPATCSYGRCDSPDMRPPADPLLLLDPNADRSIPPKEQCLYCEFFLTHGPRTAGE